MVCVEYALHGFLIHRGKNAQRAMSLVSVLELLLVNASAQCNPMPPPRSQKNPPGLHLRGALPRERVSVNWELESAGNFETADDEAWVLL